MIGLPADFPFSPRPPPPSLIHTHSSTHKDTPLHPSTLFPLHLTQCRHPSFPLSPNNFLLAVHLPFYFHFLLFFWCVHCLRCFSGPRWCFYAILWHRIQHDQGIKIVTVGKMCHITSLIRPQGLIFFMWLFRESCWDGIFQMGTVLFELNPSSYTHTFQDNPHPHFLFQN